MVVMVVASVVGQGLGWAAKSILRDHLQKKKLAMDQEHLAAVRQIQGPPEAAEEPQATTSAEAPAPGSAG